MKDKSIQRRLEAVHIHSKYLVNIPYPHSQSFPECVKMKKRLRIKIVGFIVHSVVYISMAKRLGSPLIRDDSPVTQPDKPVENPTFEAKALRTTIYRTWHGPHFSNTQIKWVSLLAS